MDTYYIHLWRLFYLRKIFANNLDPEQARLTPVLIGIQTVWDSYGIPERAFAKCVLLFKTSDGNYRACKELIAVMQIR